jgi:hypothetical protein
VRDARRWWSPGGRGGRRRGGGWRGGGGAPGQVGKEAARVPGADGGGPAAWRGARASTDFGSPAAAENTVGQRMGDRRERRSGRMTAAAAEEDTATTMAADRGRKMAKCRRGRVAAFIYRHTFSPASCNEP